MEGQYHMFTLADPHFYDVPYSGTTQAPVFRTAERELPPGWRREPQDDWFVFHRPETETPAQGWKIHAAGCLDNAERILDAVWDYCVPRGIPFKFLRSAAALWNRVSKYAPRDSSGKLVTIYPADDAECRTVLTELGDILAGEPSPYILSDLRWGDGPLYVRYGAFAQRYCLSESGQLVPAIADGDGTLVPDRRGPGFHVPPWVTLPDFLAPHLAARNAVTVGDLPYRIERVLHFSNGGGIYLARDTRDDRRVVLKEGRPHSGLDARGDDAVRRVEREYHNLRQLAGIPGIPEVYELFHVGDHRFLAMEYISGTPLNKAVVQRFPLIDVNATGEDFARYAEWAQHIYRQVEATVEAINQRGVVYGDLHLFNVMVRDGNEPGVPGGDRPSIALLDFEVAAPVADGVRPGLGNPGFAAPPTVTGVDIDRYALGCLRIALFLAMTEVLWLHRPKARHFAEVIAEHFPVPRDYLDRAVEAILPGDTAAEPTPRIEPDPGQWPALRDSLVRPIVASATPDREDRLFPGDIRQFTVGGLGLAYGAAGVLYALSATGAGRYPQFEEWLLRRVKQPPRGTRIGLYDGLHGVGFALENLGYKQEALDTLDICLGEEWQSAGLDLMSGLAGIGLNLLHFADLTGEPGFSDAALRAAELVAERLGDEDSVPELSAGANPYAGLLRGSSGPALLLMRAYDHTGDPGFLDRAAVALRQDLRRCVTSPQGVLEVNEGWRTIPYLGTGSVGVGIALDEYLARRYDERFATASRAAELAAHSPMYILPGLFSGRAGILLYLTGRPEATDAGDAPTDPAGGLTGSAGVPAADPRVVRQARNLAWHAIPYADGLAFPGSGLLRLSMDLATGNAGVLLALGAALHGSPVALPLITTGRSRPATPA